MVRGLLVQHPETPRCHLSLSPETVILAVTFSHCLPFSCCKDSHHALISLGLLSHSKVESYLLFPLEKQKRLSTSGLTPVSSLS